MAETCFQNRTMNSPVQHMEKIHINSTPKFIQNRNEIGEMKENTAILTTEKNRFTLTTFVINQTTNLLRHTNCIHAFNAIDDVNNGVKYIIRESVIIKSIHCCAPFFFCFVFNSILDDLTYFTYRNEHMENVELTESNVYVSILPNHHRADWMGARARKH